MFHSFKTISFTLCLLTASVVVSSPLAHASQSQKNSVMSAADGLRFKVVQFGDLNLSTQAGNRTLYARIRTAAKRVCAETDSRFLDRRLAAHRCLRTAVTNAIASIGNSRLTAMDQGQALQTVSSMMLDQRPRSY